MIYDIPRCFRGSGLLSPRQRQVLAHIVHGQSAKQTARALGIDYKTVEVHLHTIRQRLNANSATKLSWVVYSGYAP